MINKTIIDLEYLAFLENMLTDERKAKFTEVLSQRTNHFTVVVEDVYQLHNTSAVMRSCEVFGIQNLHVIEQKYGKRIEAEIAMGAQKWVDIHRYNTVDSCVESVKNMGYQIVATSPHENDCDLMDFDISKKSAFFFGAERNGLSQKVLDVADCFVKIPMVGFTESLNISVSAAIILQNITSKLRQSEINWQLTDDDILQKRLQWARNSIRDNKKLEDHYYNKKSLEG